MLAAARPLHRATSTIAEAHSGRPVGVSRRCWCGARSQLCPGSVVAAAPPPGGPPSEACARCGPYSPTIDAENKSEATFFSFALDVPESRLGWISGLPTKLESSDTRPSFSTRKACSTVPALGLDV